MLENVVDAQPVDNVSASEAGGGRARFIGWLLAGVGLAGLVAAAALHPSAARSAASQGWTPFVLVAGLLLIGLVADDDGLFAAAGHRLARTAPNGVLLFFGAAAAVGAVTAVLNLDTSVAFLTPVFVYTARSRARARRHCSTGVSSSPTPGHCSCPAPT